MYAKKLRDGVFIFPYDYMALQRDNPHTDFGAVIDVAVLFPETEQAKNLGSVLVPVVMPDKPPYDVNTQTLKPHPFIEAADGVWTGSWDVQDIGHRDWWPEGYKPIQDISSLPGWPPDDVG